MLPNLLAQQESARQHMNGHTRTYSWDNVQMMSASAGEGINIIYPRGTRLHYFNSKKWRRGNESYNFADVICKFSIAMGSEIRQTSLGNATQDS